jgi:putative ABC transport system permease protein
LDTLGSVLAVLTFAVGALGSISLLVGGGLGLLSGVAIVLMLQLTAALPVSYSPGFMLLSVMLAMLVGLVAGILPAIRAAALEPVDALRVE